MENKPNLYIFLIDVSGSMQKHIEQVNEYVNNFLVEHNYKNEYIAFIEFSDTPYLVSNPKLIDRNYKVVKYTENKENIEKAYDFLENKKSEWEKYYKIKKIYLLTDEEYNKSDIELVKFPIIKKNNTNNLRKIICYLLLSLISSSLSVCLFIFLILAIYEPINTENHKANKDKINKVKEKIDLDIKTNFSKISKNDTIKIDFKPKIEYEYYGLVIKYIFEFSLQTERRNYTIPYYPDGAYDIENPKCKCPISIKFANFAVGKIESDLNTAYISKEYPLYINITGETDNNPIKKPYKYKYKGDTTESIKFVLNGEDTVMKFTKNYFITHNKMLACLRSYSIAKFLIHKLPIIEQNKNNIKYFATTNLKEVGGEHRKTKIELVYKDYTCFYWFILIIVIMFLFIFYLFVKYFKGTIQINIILFSKK